MRGVRVNRRTRNVLGPTPYTDLETKYGVAEDSPTRLVEGSSLAWLCTKSENPTDGKKL
jgi:hypothetical protein